MMKERRLYEEIDRRLFERWVKPLVTPEIIEEHRRSPFGFHSDGLERVLRYVRKNRGGQAGQYVIVRTKPDKEWAIARLSGVRGVPAEIGPDRFTSLASAEHGVFLRRLRDLGLLAEREAPR